MHDFDKRFGHWLFMAAEPALPSGDGPAAVTGRRRCFRQVARTGDSDN